MEGYLASISVPAIAAAVYFIIKLIRHAVGENAKFERFIPLIAAALGVVFAIVCFYALPAVIPADNIVVAIVLGCASGFTAIGTDQMMKQFGKKTENSQTTVSDKEKDVSSKKSEETTDNNKK